MHDPAIRAEIAQRVARLQPSSVRRWGRMSVDQMLWHVNAMLRMALGELQTMPTDTLFERTVFKWVVLRGPWPKGKAPTAPELIASSAYDFQAEREQLLALLEQVGGEDSSRRWPRHPTFGEMSGLEWSWLQCRHVDYHLQQFGV